MSKYLLTTSQTVYYEYEVEAEDGDEAAKTLRRWLKNGLPDGTMFREVPTSGGDEEIFRIATLASSPPAVHPKEVEQ